jgi:hypothetical protein
MIGVMAEQVGEQNEARGEADLSHPDAAHPFVRLKDRCSYVIQWFRSSFGDRSAR